MKQVMRYAVVAAVAAIVGFASQARAMSVSWGDQGSPWLTENDGQTLVPIGTALFLGKDANGTVAGFVAYDSGFVGDGTGYAGSFGEAGSGAGGAGFFTSQMYIMVGSGNALVTETAWTFPAGDDGNASIDLSVGTLQIIVGSYSPGTVTDPNLGGPGQDALVTTIPAPIVPEPSSIMLVVIGLLGSVSLLRRRS